MIVAKPEAVTPMMMMVLGVTASTTSVCVTTPYSGSMLPRIVTEVAVPNVPQLETAVTAMRDFNALAGPIINGYAFCNLTMQQATRSRAIAWVEANPYEAVFNERLPARTTIEQPHCGSTGPMASRRGRRPRLAPQQGEAALIKSPSSCIRVYDRLETVVLQELTR